MLLELQIKNIGIIDNLVIEFAKGLNVLTGETGAGKSIIISALSLILGERVKPLEILKTGFEEGKVTGLFNIEENHIAIIHLVNSGVSVVEGEIVITRMISKKGKNRCLINGQIVTVSMLKELGDLLVDVHGTHDHQKLLNVSSHINCLDRFGHIDNDLKEFRVQYLKWNDLQSKLDQIKNKLSQNREKIEYLKFQMNELSYLEKVKESEDKLENEYGILNDCTRLKEISQKAIFEGKESDDSILSKLKDFRDYLEELNLVEPSFKEPIEEIDSLTISLSEACHHISNFSELLESDSKRLNYLEDLLSNINMHKNKYAKSFKELLFYYKELKEQVKRVDDPESLDELEQKRDAFLKKTEDMAVLISIKRKKQAKKLKLALEKELKELGMEHAFINVFISKNELSLRGRDSVEFMIITNPGEKEKPLLKIASGGELCRIMLAFKAVTASIDDIPILVFDEIDANIGGVTSIAAAEKMKAIAIDRQVITITHQPQIAAKADRHFAVKKNQKKNFTTIEVSELVMDERVLELSRMLGGADITSVVKKHAQEMIGG